jgi:23S rRNA pseudouridine2605 synthase
MAKSPKKEQGNGKKFQDRLPGEKRNRKIDLAKSEPKKTKFFTDNKSTESNTDKPRFGGDRDKPRFGNDRGGDKPRFGGDRDKPRFGNDRGGDKPRFGGDRDKPRFGNDSGGDKPRFGGEGRGSFQRNSNSRPSGTPGYTGGDKSGNPRFPGDRSSRFSKDLGDKPRFGNDRGGDKPRFGGDRDKPRFGNDRGGDKPRFGGDRDKPRFGTDRGGDKPRFSGDRDKPRFGTDRGGDKPRFGGDRDKPRFGNDGGGDKPRFGGDRDKPSFGNDRGGDKPRFGGDREKPRFGNDRGGDKPRFGGDREKPRFGSDRGGDKPRFGGDRDKPRFGTDRGGDKPRFGSDRPSDKAPENRRETFDSAEKFNKPKPTGAVGLSKFRPRGSEPFVDNTPDNRDFNEDKPKTYGIPKAEKADTPKGFKGSKREFNKVASNLEKGAEHAKSDEIRLNRYIANSGICSRREADELIQQGMVRVNGDVVTELGTKIRPSDNVKVEDRKVIPEKPVYIIMNKPKGYITTTDDPEGRKTVMELIDLPGKERIYPIGRLDRNTTGVLLLTNDGEMTQKLMHPSFEIKKVYRATLDKKPSKEHMLQLVQGVELEDGMMAFEQCGFVEEGKENVLGIEIKSGRNRIVRRMFEHFGYEVTALDRVLLGEFDKVKLGRGKWRFLTEKEMNYVDRLKRTKPKAPKN